MSARTVSLGLLVALALSCSWERAASAAPSSLEVSDGGAGGGAAASADDLLRQLTRDVESLSVADCALACKALRSMERARDRICALAPGARCDEARAKVMEATRRVSSSCPACTPAEERPQPAPPADGSGSEKAAVREAAPASVQSEHRTGGCAGCATTSARGGYDLDAALVMLAMFGLRRVTRKRRG